MQRSAFKKNTSDLSPEIYRLAQKKELGELRNVYPVDTGETIGCAAISCITLNPFIALIIASLRPPLLTLIWIVAVSGTLLLMGVFCLIFPPRIYPRWQVSLWHNGFIYEKKQIRETFRWNQIKSVEVASSYNSKLRQPSIQQCKVCRHDGYEVKLHIFSKSHELTDVVLEESAWQLAQQELSIIPPQITRTFTSLKLDRQGVGNEKETLSWQEIQDFMAKDGAVTLRKKVE